MEQDTEHKSKKSPIFWIIMVVILLISAGVAYGLLSNNPDITNNDSKETTATNADDETFTNPTPPTDTASSADSKTYNISYTDNCYEPANLTIFRGDTVVFTNNSSTKMWPASADHPSHTKYPEFDSKESISSGETYSFAFGKTGTWGFHDHNKSSCEGTITVN